MGGRAFQKLGAGIFSTGQIENCVEILLASPYFQELFKTRPKSLHERASEASKNKVHLLCHKLILYVEFEHYS